MKNSKSHLLTYKILHNPQPESTFRLFLHEVNEILVPMYIELHKSHVQSPDPAHQKSLGTSSPNPSYLQR